MYSEGLSAEPRAAVVDHGTAESLNPVADVQCGHTVAAIMIFQRL